MSSLVTKSMIVTTDGGLYKVLKCLVFENETRVVYLSNSCQAFVIRKPICIRMSWSEYIKIRDMKTKKSSMSKFFQKHFFRQFIYYMNGSSCKHLFIDN